MSIWFRSLRPAALGVLVLMAACDVLSSGGRGQVSLSFGSAGSTLRAASDVTLTNGSHTLALQSATLVLNNVELDHEGSASSANDDDEGKVEGERESEEISLSTISVDLKFDGSSETVVSVPVPAGRYKGLEATVVTVRVKGTYDGKAFDVTVPANTKIDAEFEKPLVVDAGQQLNITVKLNPQTWFARSDGTLIDPALLATNATLRAEVISRIRADFRAFEDDDRDGERD